MARLLAKVTFPTIVSCWSTLRIGPYLLLNSEKQNVFEKMTIYLYGEVQPQRKSRHSFNALITREIVRSRPGMRNAILGNDLNFFSSLQYRLLISVKNVNLNFSNFDQSGVQVRFMTVFLQEAPSCLGHGANCSN